MKTQIIQLDNHDDLISARDKMAWSKSPRILLIWPQKGRLLERTVDLLVLQRYAQSLGAQLGLVSSSLHIQGQARELGIPGFRNVSQAQRQTWRRFRGRKRLNLRLLDRKPEAAGLRQKFTQYSAVRNVNPESSWLRTGAFTLGVASVFILMLMFWPSARIELKPAHQVQKIELDLHASPEISSANISGGMPANKSSVIVEGSEQVRSSGKVLVPVEPASGYVTISNLGNSELVVPAGTVVTTTEGEWMRYETLKEARIDGNVGSQVDVNVRALLPGTKGNTSAGTIRAIEGAVGLHAAVDNPQPIRGGSDQLSPGPSEEDYAGLRDRLLASLRATAQEDFRRNLNPDQRLLDKTIQVDQVITESMEPQSGLPGDFAKLAMQVKFTAWYVNEEDMQTVARTALDANRVEGFIPDERPVRIQFLGQPVIEENNGVNWRISAERDLQAVIDPGRAGREVVGTSPEHAVNVMQNNYLLDEPALVEMSPRWWPRMPFLSFRILVDAK